MPEKRRHERPYKRRNPGGAYVWVARYTGPDGKRKSAGSFELKRDAQDAIDNAYLIPERQDTVGAYFPRWLEEHPVSERTKQTNKIRINAVLKVELNGVALKDWPLYDLRRRQAKDLAEHMLVVQGKAPEGVRNVLRSLSSMAESAIADELMLGNPFKVRIRDDDRRAQKHSREIRVWTMADMHEFASYAGKYEPMIRMLSDCGLRIGELFALQRDLQDLREGLFRVKGSAWEGRIAETSREKDHDREGPIPPGCLAMLREMPVRIDAPWLFPSPQGSLWRYSNFLRRVWQPVCVRAAMDPRPNEFRHSWISFLRAEGVNPSDLAEIAGHSVDTANQHYVHALRRSYDAMRAVIG